MGVFVSIYNYCRRVITTCIRCKKSNVNNQTTTANNIVENPDIVFDNSKDDHCAQPNIEPNKPIIAEEIMAEIKSDDIAAEEKNDGMSIELIEKHKNDIDRRISNSVNTTHSDDSLHTLQFGESKTDELDPVATDAKIKLINNLKAIASVQEGQKLWLQEDGVLVIDTSMWPTLSRWRGGQSKDILVPIITGIITEASKLANTQKIINAPSIKSFLNNIQNIQYLYIYLIINKKGLIH